MAMHNSCKELIMPWRNISHGRLPVAAYCPQQL